MSDWTEIKRIPSGDGNRRMIVLAEPRGLFRFEEETYATQDGYNYWDCTHISGLYDSAEAAERDAHIELPWLREFSK